MSKWNLVNSIDGRDSCKDLWNVDDLRGDVRKFVYSAKYLPNRKSVRHPSSSRIVLGHRGYGEGKVYSLNRTKFQEIAMLCQAINAVILTFSRATEHLEMAHKLLSNPVATFLDVDTTFFEAWVGITAEALRLAASDDSASDVVSSKKKKLRAEFKHVLRINVLEMSEVIQSIGKVCETCGVVLKNCEKTIKCVANGFQSRFYQSVWQSQTFREGSSVPEGGRVGEGAGGVGLKEALSEASMLSIHLLKPSVRWDIDGLSVRRQVSKSWPLLKFSSLSLENRILFLSDIFAGFIEFLNLYFIQVSRAVETLEELGSDSPKSPGKLGSHPLSQGFQNIFAVLLSEKYFHPPEQRKALVFMRKLKESFRNVQKKLGEIQADTLEINESWERVFKNGDLNSTNVGKCVKATSVPMWKSCKEFCFCLDLCPSYQMCDGYSNQGKFEREKGGHMGFVSELIDHLEALEDFEASYRKVLEELRGRTDLRIVQTDVEACSDLAQQFFFSFEHVGSTLHGFTKELVRHTKALFATLPTDSPLSTSSYFNRRNAAGTVFSSNEVDNFQLFRITGWQASILEMLYSIASCSNVLTESRKDKKNLGREEVESLREKCLTLSKSLITLDKLTRSCGKNYKKAEEYMEEILNDIEKYFDPLEDSLKILSRVSSTDPMRNHVRTTKEEPVVESVVIGKLEEGGTSTEEVSIFVTVNGIYINQKGVLFSSRLDILAPELRIQLVQLFVRYAISQVMEAVDLSRCIVQKFKCGNGSNEGSAAELSSKNWKENKIAWWKEMLTLKRDKGKAKGKTRTGGDFLIDGSLEEAVYSKTLLHILDNICKSFNKNSVKTNLKLSNELEALILIRLSRILEEEITHFGQACEGLRQELSKVHAFNAYFEKSCRLLFNNQVSGVTPPLERWSDRICCFKLLIEDEGFKRELDGILKGGGESSRGSGNTEIQEAHPAIPSIRPAILNRKSQTPILLILNTLRSNWMNAVQTLEELLVEENAFRREVDEIFGSGSEFPLKCVSEEKHTFLSQTEAVAILIAFALTQLKLDTFPKKYKLHLIRKMRSAIAQSKERSKAVALSLTVLGEKAEKILEFLQSLYRTYVAKGPLKHVKLVESTREMVEIKRSEAGNRSECREDLNENCTGDEKSGVGGVGEVENVQRSLDVIVSLSFPYDSLVLGYKGYENSVCFRRWAHRSHDQLRILEAMMLLVLVQSEKVSLACKQVQSVFSRLERGLKKFADKVDESLPLTLDELNLIMGKVKSFQKQIFSPRVEMLCSLEDAHTYLENSEKHLELAMLFLETNVDMMKDPSLTAHDATLTLRNPVEKDIRELFKKPILVTVPCDKFPLKLW